MAGAPRRRTAEWGHMTKRILGFAAGAALAGASWGCVLLVTSCGGRTLLEERAAAGGSGSSGASSGSTSGTTSASTAGTTTSGVATGSQSGVTAGSSSGVTGAAGSVAGSSGAIGTGGSFAGSAGITGTSGSIAGSTGITGTTGSFAGNTGSAGSVTGDTAISGTFVGTSGTFTNAAPPPPDGAVVLDDMRNLESPSFGYWYSYSDRVIPFSEPPIVQATMPGTMTPSEGTTFYSTAATDPRAPIIPVHDVAQPWPFREASGQGNDVWGAGFGMDFTDVRPATSSPVVAAINACPITVPVSPLYDATNPNARVPSPLDAQFDGYTGIGFYAVSFDGPVAITVTLDDPRTNGWGGTCDVCLNGGRCHVGADGGMDCPCSDSFALTVLLTSGWEFYSFRFADKTLKTQNWSGQNLTPGSILSSALYNLHFQFTTANGQPLAPYDVGVAYVTWLTN